MSEHRQTFGEYVRDLRLAAGLTQEGLSEASGLARVTIAKIETDHHVPNMDSVLLLAAALGVELRELAEKMVN